MRQRTRLINQLHHLLALTFPELALLTKDLATGWVLQLIHRYPTAPLLAQATPPELATIAYLPQAQVMPLLEHARTSIASLTGPAAAVLTAFIVDIGRFATPGQLVADFGTLPPEASSGVDREGQARSPRRYVMSRHGNDLVRGYLWMAALSAIRCNPAVRALYARVVAKHPQQKALAVGHAMRKLSHLVFALWKSGRPFDPSHYPWHTPAHLEASDT